MGDFLEGKGFYIVLFLCVAAIGISGYYLFSSLTPDQPDAPVAGTAQIHVVDHLTGLTVSRENSTAALTSLTLEPSDTPDRLDTFQSMMRPFSILEVARTGVIAVQKGGGKI